MKDGIYLGCERLRWTIWVFSALISILLFNAQSDIEFSAYWKFEAVDWSYFLNLAYSVKSSAYFMTLQDDGTLKSFIYTSQSHGPNLVPCGVPIVISLYAECSRSLTLHCLLLRKSLISVTRPELTLSSVSLEMMMFGFSLSKAFDISIRAVVYA